MIGLTHLLSCLRRFWGREAATRHPRVLLTLESLELRVVPVDLIWDPVAGSHEWEDPANWKPVGGGARVFVPDTSADRAIFDGSESNTYVKLDDADLTVGWLEVKNGFTAEIQLHKDLTIKTDPTDLQQSYIDSGAKIAPKNSGADLILNGALLTVYDGEIGSTTNKSQVRVEDSGTLYFSLKDGAVLGMDLIVGKVGGGAGEGTAIVANQMGGFGGRNLLVRNDANITIHKDSLFKMQGDSEEGWVLDDGTSSGYVEVYGDLGRFGVGTGKIQMPVLVRAGGEIYISALEPDVTILSIDSNGIAATSNRSLLVQDAGNVNLASSAAGLQVKEDAVFDGGDLYARKEATIYAHFVEFLNQAEVFMDGGDFTQLTFALDDAPGAQVKFTSGTWHMDVDPMMEVMADYVFVSGGSLNISNTNTTLHVIPIGGAPDPGMRYLLFGVVDGVLSGTFANTNPAGKTQNIIDDLEIDYLELVW